ncbi:MAG: DUF308 domain-containing protein [Lachnospiraceae bacterium]|nr:DUF308 domain-containing protein [Lachnospiraceae bacterium]
MAPESIRSVRRYMLIVNIVMLLMGAAFIAWPKESSQMLARVLGVSLILFAVFGLGVFIFAKSRGITDFISLIGSAIVGIMGIIFTVNPDLLISVFNIVFGAIIILVGLANIHQAIFILRKVRKKWWISLLIAFLAVGLGVFIIINPFSFSNGLMIWIGLGLIIEAVFGFFNLPGLRNKKTSNEEIDY